MLFFMTLIYFARPISENEEDVKLYGQIIKHLKEYGQVLNEVLNEDPHLLERAHAIVAEVTIPSLGVGYEIGRCIERNTMLCEEEKQRILCLHRPFDERRLSPTIAGCEDSTLREYINIEEARRYIDDFFIKR